MSSFTIEAQSRSDLGKGASRRLRREQGTIPAIIFGGDKAPQPLTLSHKDLIKSIEDESFFSSVLNVKVDGKSELAVLKDLQRHPAKNVVLHADFLRIKAGDTIKMSVPLHFINEDKSAVLKLGGKATHMANQVNIICTPDSLPEFLEMDMQNVAVDQTVHLSDIKTPKGVQIAELLLGSDHDQAIANVTGKQASVEEGEEAAPSEPAAE